MTLFESLLTGLDRNLLLHLTLRYSPICCSKSGRLLSEVVPRIYGFARCQLLRSRNDLEHFLILSDVLEAVHTSIGDATLHAHKLLLEHHVIPLLLLNHHVHLFNLIVLMRRQVLYAPVLISGEFRCGTSSALWSAVLLIGEAAEGADFAKSWRACAYPASERLLIASSKRE